MQSLYTRYYIPYLVITVHNALMNQVKVNFAYIHSERVWYFETIANVWHIQLIFRTDDVLYSKGDHLHLPYLEIKSRLSYLITLPER